MSQAPAYERKKNFKNDSPDRTDHTALNAEFDAVSLTVQAMRQNAQTIQADDLGLLPKIVGIEQLTDQAVSELLGGREGPVGPVGASYEADAEGLASERSNYDERERGFSFLSLDIGMLWFKVSVTSGQWSPGFPFGQGAQGIRGPVGPIGPRGPDGPRGLTGNAGPPGTVDLASVVRTAVTTEQSVQGKFSAPSFEASSYYRGVEYFFGQNLRIRARAGRFSLDNGASIETGLADLELRTLYTSGVDALNTGIKLVNGDDLGTLFDKSGTVSAKLDTSKGIRNDIADPQSILGTLAATSFRSRANGEAGNTGFKLTGGADISTLFDPAGAAGEKLSGVSTGESTVSLSGKTSLKVKLTVVNHQLVIVLEAT